jgi:hypothetical protein
MSQRENRLLYALLKKKGKDPVSCLEPYVCITACVQPFFY